MKKYTAIKYGREVGGRGGALLIHRFAVPLLQQEKAKVRRREVGGKEGVLLIHRFAVPLSRCGSGTLGLFHSPRSEIQSPRAASLPAGEGKGAKRRGRRESGRTPHPPRSGPPSPAGEGEGTKTRGRRERGRTPHPPLRGPPSPAGEGKGCGDGRWAQERT